MAHLGAVLCLTGGHRPFRWGFDIARTAYGPGTDEQFQHALAIINRLAQIWVDDEAASVKKRILYYKQNDLQLEHIPVEVDMRPNEELVRRYENPIIQDKGALDNASLATVREYFNKWIASKNVITSSAGDVRFATCIMLDAETLDQLAIAPGGFPRNDQERFRSEYWVKMVEAEPSPGEALRVRVFGEKDLMDYWSVRSSGEDHICDLMHRQNPENPGTLYYGRAPRTGFGTMSMMSFDG
jgi:hypothetical protein